MADLEEERDQFAREHYILRKKNMRATALIDGFRESFQAYIDKQTKMASEILVFAEKLREDHRLAKEDMSTKIEYVRGIWYKIAISIETLCIIPSVQSKKFL